MSLICGGPHPILTLLDGLASASKSANRAVGQTDVTGVGAINATGAWAVTTGSSNVVVAVVDSGVDFTHSDLGSPHLVPGIDETGITPVGINYASGNTDTDGHGTAGLPAVRIPCCCCTASAMCELKAMASNG